LGCVHDLICDGPAVDVGGDAALAQGATFTRQGGFEGPTAETFTATVDYGDGSAVAPLALDAFSAFTLSHRYDKHGVFHVTVRVVDSHDRVGTGTLTVTVANAAPALTMTPAADATEGALYEVAGNIRDPGADLVTAVVDWGDGSLEEPIALGPAGQATLAHTWADDGEYHVVVTAGDGELESERAWDVIVANVAPTFVSPPPEAMVEGTSRAVALTLVDPGADVLSGTYNDGSGAAARPLAIDDRVGTLVLDYPDDGTYVVTVNLQDDDGGAYSDVFSVTVTNAAPVVAAHDDVALAEGTPWTSSLAFADSGAVDVWSAEISYGDGTGFQRVGPITGEEVVPLAHVWRNQGDYVVFVRVLDDSEAVGTASFEVQVANVAPTPNAGPPETIPEGTAWTRAAVAFDPGAADLLSGAVQYGADAAIESLFVHPTTGAYTLDHTFPQEGVAAVSVTVRDNDGAATTETVVVTVENVLPAVDCGGAQLVGEGQVFTRACAFVDPGADSWTATVDWGDGSEVEHPAISPEQTFALAHVYVGEGAYTATVSVADGTGTSSVELALGVGNAPPVVDAGPDVALVEGDRLSQAGLVVDLSADDTFSATVDYDDGDGPVPLPLADDRTFVLEHDYLQEGEHTVVIDVVDSHGDHGGDVVVVEVANAPPAVDAGGDTSLDEGSTLARAVAVADPGVLDVVSVTIDFGDGTPHVQSTVTGSGDVALSHVYRIDGDFVVKVTAVDDLGAGVVDSFTVDVRNVNPLVTAGGDVALAEGSTLTRTATFADPGGDVWSAAIDYGDGSAPTLVQGVTPGTPIALQHTYVNEGEHVVRVTVTEAHGSGTATFIVSVTNVAPSLDVGADATLPEGSPLARVGAWSDPGGADVVTAEVDWGDGAPAQTLTLRPDGTFDLAHTYPDEGVFDVVVTATDGAATTVEGFEVTVTNVRPSVNAGGPATLVEGSTLTRTVSFTDPGADSWTASVDWGDGAPAEALPIGPGKTLALAHRYPDNGAFTVVVSVADSSEPGAPGLGAFGLTVTNAAPVVNAGGPLTVPLGVAMQRQGTVTDPGDDTITGTVDYGDDTGIGALEMIGPRTFRLTHVYGATGTYTVTVSASDDDGAVGVGTFKVSASNSAPLVEAGDDAALVEGARLQRVVSFSDDGPGPFSAVVDYGDGQGPIAAAVDQAARTATLDHVFADDVVASVVVTVSDGEESGSDSFVLTVANAPPVVTMGGPETIDEGSVWTRAGSYTDPGVNDVHTATVTFADGSGEQPLGLNGAAFAVSHTWADDGVFPVAVAIWDGDDTGGATVSVTVRNVAPAIAPIAAPTLAVAQAWATSVTFTDPGADTWTLVADYGDGATATKVLAGRSFAIDHTYASPGTYHASFRVTDDDGGTHVRLVDVVVSNVTPVVSAPEVKDVDEGTPVTIVATFTDAGAETHTGAIHWTSAGTETATIDEAARTATGTHTYADEGVHQVAVDVTDQWGATGSATTQVTVRNVAPRVDAGDAATVNAPGTLVRSGSFSDPGADTWTVTADFGDGTGAQTIPYGSNKRFTLSHTYATGGVYVVTVTVSDGDGGVGTDAFPVNVTLLDCSAVGLDGARQWLGGAPEGPTSWGVAANWTPAGVPGAAERVVLCAGGGYYPRLTADVTVAAVQMSPGASIASGGKKLTITGDLTGGAVTGTGRVDLTGSGAKLASGTPELHVFGTVTATASLTVAGKLTIESSGGLALAGVTVVVTDDAYVWVSGQSSLVLDEAADALDVRGDFTANATSGASSEGKLTAGTLTVAGDVTASGGSRALVMTGTALVLKGTSPQKVRIEGAGVAASRFAAVRVAAGATAEVDTAIVVGGALTVEGGAALTGSSRVFVTGALPTVQSGGSYGIAETVVIGDVALAGSVYFRNPVNDVVIEQGGSLDVGAWTLSTAGDLRVTRTARATSGLKMGAAGGRVIVGGDAEFTAVGGASAASLLSAGQIELGGSFTQASGSGTAFAPSGTRVVLAGDGAQTLSFAQPATNRFATLELGDMASVVLASDVTALALEGVGADAVVGGRHLLKVGAVDVSGVTFDGTSVLIDGALGTFEAFDDVTFVGFAPSDTRLTVYGRGLVATMHGLEFAETPGPDGYYIVGVETGTAGSSSVLTVADSLPLNGRPKTLASSGFAIVWGATKDDTDGDGLTDADEYGVGTDVLVADTDADGFLDGTEIGVATDPLDPGDLPFALAAATELTVDANPRELVVADLDADGAVDIATTSPAPQGKLTLWFNTPASKGTFGDKHSVSVVGDPRGLAVGALGGAGATIAIARAASSSVGFATAPLSSRSFSVTSSLAVGAAPVALAIGQLDNGSRLDLAVACEGADAV
ncbi:MAG: hypothetical protein KC635_09110, partial [Myxococcales bacterium]|nr:hypothetical protein [Myxococcales bacterium]